MRFEWLIAALFAALTAYGFIEARLLAQPIWSSFGLWRLGAFTICYLAAAMLIGWRARAHFGRIVVAFAAIYSVWAVGWIGPLAAAFLLFSLFATGLLLTSNAALALPCGLSMAVWLFSVTAPLPVHTRWTWLLALAIPVALKGRAAIRVLLAPTTPVATRPFAVMAAAVYLLLAHWLVALKPEVSNDGLAMHLAAPAYVAQHGFWPFDVRQFVWAVMPMNGDWLYTIAYLLGDEYAARLANFGVLAGSTTLLVRISGGWLAPALFLSTPLVQLVTGSVFVENVTALFVLAAFCALLQYRQSRGPNDLLVCAMLAGSALSTKYGAIAFVTPALFLLRRPPTWRVGLAAVLLLTVFTAPPYFAGWRYTGNPLFPFFNAVFRSPSLDATQNLVDVRFKAGWSWNTFYQMTFHSRRYLESQDGAMGFAYFLLLPAAAAAAFRRKWPQPARYALLLGVIFCLLAFSSQSNLRYLYPALPLLALGVAALNPPLPALLVLITLNTYFLASSGWYHRDFLLLPWSREDRATYIRNLVPQRLAVDYLNTHAPGQPAAFFETNDIAGFRGRAYTTSWHDPTFIGILRQTRHPADLLQRLRALDVHWFVSPAPGSTVKVRFPLVRAFLQDCAQTEFVANRFQVSSERAECATPYASPARPGDYDDYSLHVRYEGAWLHDSQFTEASENSLTYSNTTGDYLEFLFRGTELTYIYTRAFNRGIAEIQLDERKLAELDQYGAALAWQQQAKYAFADGDHRLRIRVTGRRNPASSGTFVDIDRLIVR